MICNFLFTADEKELNFFSKFIRFYHKANVYLIGECDA